MRYWWVNQNRTLKEELDGGYLWSPQRNKGGGNSWSYNFMREVVAGDLVFSYANQKIGHLGIALKHAEEASKPEEFGKSGDAWDSVGWIVSVDYTRLQNPIIPKARIGDLRDTLPEKYSPLRRDGNGKEFYLTEVPAVMATKLIEIIGEEARIIDDRPYLVPSYRDEVEEGIVSTIEDRDDISDTDKNSLIKSRRGQGKFRKRVLEVEAKCRLTGISNEDLLRASHIKPWCKCDSDRERLDGNNGLMLSPTADHLFDRGFIAFNDDGSLLLSELLPNEDRERLGLPKEFVPETFTQEQQSYLQYHRAEVYRSSQ